MKAMILGMLAETAIHAGADRDWGVVDLPVAREAATDYPFLPGSGIKGALRAKLEEAGEEKKKEADALFGKPDQAGALLVSDARLLLLPVRCLSGSYRWLTCPLILERLRRDLDRAGHAATAAPPAVDKGKVLTAGSGKIYLEERQFETAGAPPPHLVDELGQLVPHPATRARIGGALAVVCDDDFAWFARYALPVQARNKLDDDGNKQSKNLWYEEALPPDTLLYALLAGRSGAADATAAALLFPEGDRYLQAGGNETVGAGWFAVQVFGASGEVA